MTTTQLPLGAARHRNQHLFSDYYLNVLLPARADWKMLAVPAAPVLQHIREIWNSYTPSSNEAQTEDGLIKPVLLALGHTFEVQAALKTPDSTKRPDYIFYRDQAALDANKDQVLTDEMLRPSILAVGDAKHWDRPLDVAVKGTSTDPFSNKNPSYQIAFYMQHSGATWGILTNGRRWRLYHTSTAHKLDRFYEVDLPALLETGDADTFLYFYAFFHRSAFDEHDLSIARLLQASTDYAQGIGDNLKKQVYTALRHLAQGFLDYPQNQLQPDAATLHTIYDHCLIVLYRLLFILYAEARELLPVRESPLYRRQYSIMALKHEIGNMLDSGDALLPTSSRTWAQLRDLFGIINSGNPPLKVATFDGGLFDPTRSPFLEQHSIGDARLQQAIDMLARVDRQFVDYRDLSERHLGTIYEGLLEHHLRPLDPPEGPWMIDLFNDKGERKVTGSYYTPDFVVDYIVDQAVGPLLHAAVADAPDDATKVHAVLSLNVLDPSMGSGYFLVAATEYIARFLVDLDVERGEAQDEADLAYWKRRVVQACIYGVDLNPLAVDLAKLSLWLSTIARDKPLSFLDHHLRCGNALVGARLDRLQPAESAKQKRAKKQTQQATAAGQLSMLDDEGFRRSLSGAVGMMGQIEAAAGNTIDEVREQERLYETMQAQLTRTYRTLADLVTATRFGVEIDSKQWPMLRDYALGKNFTSVPILAQMVQQAQQVAEAHRFFHWELEFPEVFFDAQGQPQGAGAGFDAVIGNPPYIRQEVLGPFKPYFGDAFAETYHGVADIYVYFYQQGVQLLRQDGKLAYISSNSWLRANYATSLRSYLRQHVIFETLVDMGDNRVFTEAADVYPAIPVIRKTPPPEDHIAQVAVFRREDGVTQFDQQVAEKLVPVSIHDQHDRGWLLGSDAGRKLFEKLMGYGKPLDMVVEGRIYYGVKTGLNDAFIIDQPKRNQIVQSDPNSTQIIKPIVQGQDLRPWYQESEGRYLIFTRRGTNIDSYPVIKQYLAQFRERLEPKPKDWNSGVWPGRKPGPYEWYEVQDSVDYYEAFDLPKIFWPDIAKYPRFSWDEQGTLVNDKGCILIPQEPFVLGLLQSRTIWFCISYLCVPLGERAGLNRYQQKIQFISRLPIPDAPDAEREAIGDLAMKITELARARYALHQRSRRRILDDLGTSDRKLNLKLTAWWDLDFPAFRTEIKKVFKQDIPVKERDEWDEWLTVQREKHAAHTAEIIKLETDLNARVYALFDLTPAEIQIIEESTKYQYGEV